MDGYILAALVSLSIVGAVICVYVARVSDNTAMIAALLREMIETGLRGR